MGIRTRASSYRHITPKDQHDLDRDKILALAVKNRTWGAPAIAEHLELDRRYVAKVMKASGLDHKKGDNLNTLGRLAVELGLTSDDLRAAALLKAGKGGDMGAQPVRLNTKIENGRETVVRVA